MGEGTGSLWSPLLFATYLIGPLLVQRVGVMPPALGGSVLVQRVAVMPLALGALILAQADWALSSAENWVRLVC